MANVKSHCAEYCFAFWMRPNGARAKANKSLVFWSNSNYPKLARLTMPCSTEHACIGKRISILACRTCTTGLKNGYGTGRVQTVDMEEEQKRAAGQKHPAKRMELKNVKWTFINPLQWNDAFKFILQWNNGIVYSISCRDWLKIREPKIVPRTESHRINLIENETTATTKTSSKQDRQWTTTREREKKKSRAEGTGA